MKYDPFFKNSFILVFNLITRVLDIVIKHKATRLSHMRYDSSFILTMYIMKSMQNLHNKDGCSQSWFATSHNCCQ